MKAPCVGPYLEITPSGRGQKTKLIQWGRGGGGGGGAKHNCSNGVGVGTKTKLLQGGRDRDKRQNHLKEVGCRLKDIIVPRGWGQKTSL